MAILSSGTAIAQMISIITAPVLTRIYDPDDYGLLGVYMTFCALLSVLSTLQYSNAIVIAREDKEATDVFRLSGIINISTSLLIGILVILCKPFVAQVYNNANLTLWLSFAPLSIFFIGVNNIFSAWAVRKKEFKLLSRNRIYTAIMAPLFSISFGFIVSGATGLFIGLLVSQIVPTTRMALYFYRHGDLNFEFYKSDLTTSIRKFRNFPFFSLPADFINNFSNQIPILTLSQIGGPQIVGWYNLGVRILGLPSSLISISVGEIFRQRASEDYHKYGSCRPLFLKVFKSLTLSAIIPFSVLIIFGPDLFSFFFGEKWRGSGEIVSMIGILYFFKFAISPLSYIAYIAHKQWAGLLMDVFLFLVLSGIFLVSKSYNLDYKNTLLMLSAGYSILYSITFYMNYKFSVNEKFVSQNLERYEEAKV